MLKLTHIILCFGLLHYVVGTYKVEFKPTVSPPATIPTDCTQLKYSLPLGRQSSYPVEANLKLISDSSIVETGDNSMAKFDIESVDSVTKTATGDSWVTSGGELCQWGDQGLFPRRMQREFFKKRCFNSTKLTGFTTDRGLLNVDGLFHQHPTDTTPSGFRIYIITVHLADGTTVSAESHAFRVDPPAAELVIVNQPPASVAAQEAFNFDIKVVDNAGNTLTTGADSCLFAEIQVYWTKETSIFYHKEIKTEMLHTENIRMRGLGIAMKASMYSYVIRKQMNAGVATFNGVEILDVTAGVKLNVTTFMQSFPFSRRPDDYSDLSSIVRDVVDNEDIFYQNLSYPLSKAVKLTNSIQVTEQTADKIVILDKPSIDTKQGANFPINNIEIEVRDSNNKRVYSGQDSALVIQVTTTPSDACLSVDSVNITTVGGRAVYEGSICAAIAAVKLHFDATSVISTNPVIGDETGNIEITSEIHLASFADNKFSGSDNNIGPNIDSFSHFAAQDVNTGYFSGILDGRSLELHSYDTNNNIQETIKQYKIMMDSSKDDPSKRVRGIIGFGSNTLSLKMQPWLTQDRMPQIATREDQYDFGDKNLYPYYSRVNWGMGASTHSVMMAARDRGWTKIVVMRQIDYDISKIFYTKAREFGLEMSEVTIPTVPMSKFGQHGVLANELQKVKDAKTRIIWVFCLAPQLYKLIREAIHFGIAPINGYQWVTMGITAWHVPFSNQISICSEMTPICTVGLTGMANFDSTYYLAGLRTSLWDPVLTRHIKKDRMDVKGTVSKHTLIIATSAFALGYDAMLLYAYGLDKLVKENRTISGQSLAEAVRSVTIHGLTGEIALNPDGNRPGYRGFLEITDPHPPTLGIVVSAVAIFPRYFEIESDTATTQLELSAKLQWPLFLEKNVTPPYEPYNPLTLPTQTYLNKRIYNGSDGMLDFYEVLVPVPPNTDPPQKWILLEEDTVAPFYCESGCGGNQTNRFDITEYENGKCINMNECSCNEGFVGDDCSEMICICVKGYCEVPNTCICSPGWTGIKCDVALCAEPCDQGVCSSPDVCTCNSGYTGATCGSHYGVVVGIPVVLISIFLVLGAFFGRWFLKKQALKAALANLDWKVNWDEEVQTGVGAISMVSTAGDDLMHSNKNFITWKSVRSYAQNYPCESLNVNDVSFRLEIVQLKELRHVNLIHFIGACLDYPNVSILTEPCPKGSLEDLLANDNVKLGWDFKYSLLKDICRGMDYLHRSEIGSHGRLKSTNCLVDNRWTCKITGFGAPSIRYKASRKSDPGKEDVQLNSTEKNLFWTSPELLQSAKCIEDVGSGTTAGDCYSFAIIMSEVISREEPFANEMSFLKPEDVLVLILNKDAPEAAKAKRRWYESGGDTMKVFRPKIENSDLPEDYTAKTGLKKLVETNWSEKPENRLSFRQNLDKLNEIHPIKGELIDNLVNMLEKYSSNLEAIVSDRTKELIAEKAKTEMLISQMFPKSVAEDLKHGRSVEAESFECVTIFFSDLVGFTAIAKQSTPIQVVALLNDLYTTFDAILDNYDVYKVETIGDAYMVVSGLPIRNGDNHAGEISTMSLDLLSSMCDFKIRHMPGEFLQLRIGMHSGPCVAGVVGLKMPRYCLFGDTVNTASRMESSSIALRIHMSDKTANILFKLGGYHLDCRGEREVKGKGMMTTYWLEGKDGFAKPLPTKEMAASLSQHEFK